jgi:basic amino acid/polyamine antiporter, APA family
MHATPSQSENEQAGNQELIRGIGLGSAITLTMETMIGVGPFITIPLIVSAAGGPQAMLGWICGAILALCDGLIWAELGAAMPGSGGSYRYLSEIYGPKSLGKLISFLFVWQLSFSAPLSIASGCLGFEQYASYIWPLLEHPYFSRDMRLPIPLLGALEGHVLVTAGTFLAMGICLFGVLLLYRRITSIGRISKFLWAGVMGTILWVIVTGLSHFNAARAFSFPTGAFHLSHGFLVGLGASMLITTYDYWGYYNVCFFGGEIKNPEKTIPRAMLLSIVLVAGLYLLMNVSILGVIPWQELVAAAKTDTRFYVVSTLMQRIYGSWAGYLASALIMWTAFSSVFSLLLGYSRVPYAAALDGNYFRVFAKVHPQGRFPYVSLLALGGVAAAYCFLRLADVIAALVVIRIMIQFLVQAAGLIVLRIRRADMPRPFRMWLYPAPAVAAIAGFVFILVNRPDFQRQVRYAMVILILGIVIYLVRAARRHEWPFGTQTATLAEETPGESG